MTLVYWLDLLGCAVFAISGALAAGRKELDLVGVVALAFVTAIGGGTLRDLLLDRNPIFWLHDQLYIVVIAGAALATVALSRWRPSRGKALLVADGLGLALFSVLGAQISDRAGAAPLACVLLGAMTGCAGGVIRDVLVTETPLVFRRGHLYVTCAIAGAGTYVAGLRLGVDTNASALAAMFIVATMRFVSIWRNWALPVFRLPRDRE
ncbi:MAG TPA: trimeric intracellular cation channel family protein [Xanthomonadales bacterium]|nr:trimeric intracellular cation channel family protein [Xanthomonadales bacterium]